MDLNLTGKVAIVTGGGSGLGASTSEMFAQEGANVVVIYIEKKDQMLKFVEDLNHKYGTNCIALFGDVTKPSDIENVINQTIETYGKIDILVNGVGTWPTAYVIDMSDEEWEQTIRVNLSSAFYFSKRMVKHLLERQSNGKIINIVSQAAFHGSTTGHAHYAAAKGGLVTFTVSLAREVAKHGINVTAVAPGIMRTPMNEKVLAENEDYYLQRIPLNRIADSREVANVVVFLASSKADYITGATIDVTGGMLMR